MDVLLIQQYVYESKTWDRLLNYMQEENIQYKTRIANILAKDIDNLFVEMIELFLNKFVLQDYVISVKRHELAELDKKLTEKSPDIEGKKNYDRVTVIQNKLRGEIEIMERYFNNLKFEFNKYLSDQFANAK